MERMEDLEEMLRELSEKYKNSKSVEVYEEDLEGWFKIIDDLREENKNLRKEKGNIRQRLVALEKKLETLSRVKENKELIKENKKLNIKVASLEGEIKGLNSVIEKLKEENQTLELWLDNKEKVNKSLREENKKLKKYYDRDKEELMESCYSLAKENEKLKSDLANIQCEFGFECDECEFWKREIKKHKPCLIKEEYVFNLGDYDYMILTSTTPQLKIIKKNNKGASTFTIDGFTAVGKTFSSLADEEDLYEDIK